MNRHYNLNVAYEIMVNFPFRNIEETPLYLHLKVRFARRKSQTTKLRLIIEPSACADLWGGSISLFLEEMMWMASSCVLCVLQRYRVFEVLTVTLSLWGEQGKETCRTIGWDLDLCVPFSDLWPLLVFWAAAVPASQGQCLPSSCHHIWIVLLVLVFYHFIYHLISLVLKLKAAVTRASKPKTQCLKLHLKMENFAFVSGVSVSSQAFILLVATSGALAI